MGIALPIPKAQPLRYPPDVRIYRKFLPTEAKKENHVCRFLPHPRKGKKPSLRIFRGKPFQKIEAEFTLFLFDPLQDRADLLRPFPIEPCGPNGLRHLRLSRFQEVFPGGETRAQVLVREIAVSVGGVLGKNGADQEFQGIPISGMWRLPEKFAKEPIHFGHFLPCLHGLPRIEVKGMADKALREELLSLARKVLEELSPHRLLPRHLQRRGNKLVVGGQSYELSKFRRIVAVGFGKAAAAMAEALEDALGERLDGGLVIITPGQKPSLRCIEMREGGHPVPDERTLRASEELLDFIRGLGPDDLLFVLVSGGGSALFEVPAEGLSLEDLQRVNELLLKSGATIQEMNIVRKHLSAVKGGQLLRHTWAGRILVLVLSDVPGDDLGTIASGPTFPDPSTFAQAREILEARALWPDIPERVRERFLAGEKGEIPETPKPGDPFSSGLPISFWARAARPRRSPGIGEKNTAFTRRSSLPPCGEKQGKWRKFLRELPKRKCVFPDPLRRLASLCSPGKPR